MGKNFSDSVEYVKDRPGHDKKYAIDWGKIKQELNWQPEHDFESGLKATIAWYQGNQSWWKPLKKQSTEYFKQQYGQT